MDKDDYDLQVQFCVSHWGWLKRFLCRKDGMGSIYDLTKEACKHQETRELAEYLKQKHWYGSEPYFTFW